MSALRARICAVVNAQTCPGLGRMGPVFNCMVKRESRDEALPLPQSFSGCWSKCHNHKAGKPLFLTSLLAPWPLGWAVGVDDLLVNEADRKSVV